MKDQMMFRVSEDGGFVRIDVTTPVSDIVMTGWLDAERAMALADAIMQKIKGVKNAQAQ